MHDETPHATPAESPEKPPRPVCGAKTRSGKPCASSPVAGSLRCRMHGGTAAITNAGPGNGNWKGGRYSKWLAPALQEDFTAALAEGPDALDLLPELALVETRLNERLRQLSEAGVPEWGGILEAVGELKAATRARDTTAISAAVRRLEDTARAGAGTDAAWKDVRGLIHDRRRLVAAETARRARLLEYVEAERHRASLRLLAATVTEEVNNLPAIAAALLRNEGVLDVPKLKYALFTRIGRRLAEVAPLLYPKPGEKEERRGL
jgi:hypothetical protein